MNKLLIHTCCTDCVLKMIDAITSEEAWRHSQFDLYFYNPNIHPETEWTARLKALQQVALAHNWKVIVANWQPVHYFSAISQNRVNNIDYKNRTSRCPACISLRLSTTAEYAARNQYSAFSTTMITSPYLDSDHIKSIGKHQANRHGLTFIIPTSINQCLHTSGFYKQNYCGCVYSLQERIEEKYLE